MYPRYIVTASATMRFARVNIYRGGNLYTVDVKTFTPWVTYTYTVGTVFFIYRGGYTVGNRFFFIPWSRNPICRGEQILFIPWGIYRGEQILYIPWGTCRVVQSIYSVAPQYKANASRYKANPTRYKTWLHGISPTVYQVYTVENIYTVGTVYIVYFKING